MTRRILLIVAIIFFGVNAVWQQLRPQFNRQAVEVTRQAASTDMHEATSSVIIAFVLDGDTVELTTGERVRYIGIDAPESSSSAKKNECYSKEATEANRKLVEGKTVRLEKDISDADTYGRLLRYVYSGDVSVNEQLVRGGFARVATYPPDVRYEEVFQAAQADAQKNNQGLWDICR